MVVIRLKHPACVVQSLFQSIYNCPVSSFVADIFIYRSVYAEGLRKALPRIFRGSLIAGG